MVDRRKNKLDPGWLDQAATTVFGPTRELTGEASAPALELTQALGSYLDVAYRRRNRKWSRLTPDQQLDEAVLFLRGLANTIEAQRLASISETLQNGTRVRTFNYAPHTIELAASNNLGVSLGTLELKDRQKRMLTIFAAKTQIAVGSYLDPWITRAELSQIDGALSPSQFTDGILDPMAEVGLTEINPKLGYRLRCAPEDLLVAVVAKGHAQSLRVKDLGGWSEVEDKPVLVSKHQLPVISSLLNQVTNGKASDRIDINRIKLDTGLRSRDGIYDQLSLLVAQGILESAKPGNPYRVAQLDCTLLEAVIKAQRPVEIKLEKIEYEDTQAAIVQPANVRELPLSVTEATGKQTFEPDKQFLDILAHAFRKEVAGVVQRGQFTTGYLRPTAVQSNHRTLSRKDKSIPWRELQRLGLALERGRDHHHEMLMVGGLITALYLNKTIYGESNRHSNGTSALEVVARHTAYLLKQEERRLSGSDTEAQRLRYVKICLQSLQGSGMD